MKYIIENRYDGQVKTWESSNDAGIVYQVARKLKFAKSEAELNVFNDFHAFLYSMRQQGICVDELIDEFDLDETDRFFTESYCEGNGWIYGSYPDQRELDCFKMEYYLEWFDLKMGKLFVSDNREEHSKALFVITKKSLPVNPAITYGV